MARKKLKSWPADGSPVDAEALIRPVIDAAERTHRRERRQGVSARYDGYVLGPREAAICGTEIEPVGFDEWFYIAFQLGLEQGRRLVTSNVVELVSAVKRSRIALTIIKMSTLHVERNPLAVTRKSLAFVDGVDERGDPSGGVDEIAVTTAPPTPHGLLLRRLRHALGLTLSDAADAFVLGVADVSGLERGILVVSDDEFVKACAMLVAAAKVRAASRKSFSFSITIDHPGLKPCASFDERKEKPAS